MRRFWATDSNNNASELFSDLTYLHTTTFILLSIFNFHQWDDYFEKLGEITVPVSDIFPSDFRPLLKNLACLISLISLMNQNQHVDSALIHSLHCNRMR